MHIIKNTSNLGPQHSKHFKTDGRSRAQAKGINDHVEMVREALQTELAAGLQEMRESCLAMRGDCDESCGIVKECNAAQTTEHTQVHIILEASH